MTAPLLAALLRHALPGLRVLDLALAEGGLYPWLPDAMVGLAEPDTPCTAEGALLRGFRQGGGTRPLAGCDPVQDAALAAGAPEAWAGEGPRLVVTQPDDAARWVGSGAMVLTRSAVPDLPRIMLLLGDGGAVAQRDLLLPEDRLPGVLDALSDAAQAMAAEGWEVGQRAISPRLAALALFTPPMPPPPLVLEAPALILQSEAEGRRLRVLLGVLPPRSWRVRLQVEGAVRVLLQDGAMLDVAAEGPLVEALLRPQAAPTVLGLGGEGLALCRVEILPA